ncbi:unnamed protein product [Moneuplotes crassus]|uniref:Uncharacterized protein n=1 Tax=Euplotes crassus TaxID=5936 RepID=A0AAD1UI27_EUPCR|nr:unnamed protein product [Moneuplotes crassus]
MADSNPSVSDYRFNNASSQTDTEKFDPLKVVVKKSGLQINVKTNINKLLHARINRSVTSGNRSPRNTSVRSERKSILSAYHQGEDNTCSMKSSHEENCNFVKNSDRKSIKNYGKKKINRKTDYFYDSEDFESEKLSPKWYKERGQEVPSQLKKLPQPSIKTSRVLSLKTSQVCSARQSSHKMSTNGQKGSQTPKVKHQNQAVNQSLRKIKLSKYYDQSIHGLRIQDFTDNHCQVREKGKESEADKHLLQYQIPQADKSLLLVRPSSDLGFKVTKTLRKNLRLLSQDELGFKHFCSSKQGVNKEEKPIKNVQKRKELKLIVEGTTPLNFTSNHSCRKYKNRQVSSNKSHQKAPVKELFRSKNTLSPLLGSPKKCFNQNLSTKIGSIVVSPSNKMKESLASYIRNNYIQKKFAKQKKSTSSCCAVGGFKWPQSQRARYKKTLGTKNFYLKNGSN